MENASDEDLFKPIERPEDVDKLDLDDAFSWLEWKKIPYDQLETLEEMQALIKHYLETHGSSKEVAKTNGTTANDATNSQLLMGELLTKDKIMKEELSDVYLELMKFVDEDQRSVMEQLYGGLNEKLVTYQEELKSNECPIVVAGETNAGKSSLLNLLLGTDVLPHSLCASSTICRLHNSKIKRVEIVTKENDTIPIEVDDNDPDAEENLKEKLRHFVSSTESRKNHLYKQVEIYWPLPMLQDRVTIVDTPGVGESDQISDRLFEYLPNALVFIYVINSANAGGIQEDRLLHILEKQEQWQLEGRLTVFDYTSTIIVCNKWDIVEKRHEEEKVWKDTGSKLQKALPGFPLNQVFRMSVYEADRYMKTGLGMTAKFKSLLDSINIIVPATLKAKTSRHFKFLDMFLHQLQSKIQSRLSNAKKSEEEKKQLHDDVVGRLENLKTCSVRGTLKVKSKLLDTAKKDIQLEFQPLLYELRKIMGKLRFYELKYMATDLMNESDLRIEKVVGKGRFSDEYLAIMAFGDKKEKVAMKVLRRKLNCVDMVSQLEEVECLKKFNHTNIVKIYGACFTACGEDKETENNEIGNRLTMVHEFSDCNLEDLVFRNEKLQCRVYRSIPERKEAFRFYIEMSVGICDGLTKMHQMGYLHRDLKLSNVLVKNNTAKLSDLRFAKMEVDMTGTFVGTMSHMSPELLKQEIYTFSSDVYSLAILLWELWYGHHVYTESEYAYHTIFEILNGIKNGLRPKLEWKHGPTNELKKNYKSLLARRTIKATISSSSR